MEKSVLNSLKTLNVEAVDVLFLHDPNAITVNDDVELIFKQMQDFKRQGLAKKIGIGGNLPDWLQRYDYSAIFDVVMEFNRLDACCSDALTDTMPHYESNNIQFYSASPLHMGLLGNKYQEFVDSPPVWLDRESVEKAVLIKKIADKYGMSLPSLAHRYILSLPKDFKMVIGSSNSEQLLTTLADIKHGCLPYAIFKEITSLKTI